MLLITVNAVTVIIIIISLITNTTIVVDHSAICRAPGSLEPSTSEAQPFLRWDTPPYGLHCSWMGVTRHRPTLDRLQCCVVNLPDIAYGNLIACSDYLGFGFRPVVSK